MIPEFPHGSEELLFFMNPIDAPGVFCIGIAQWPIDRGKCLAGQVLPYLIGILTIYKEKLQQKTPF